MICTGKILSFPGTTVEGPMIVEPCEKFHKDGKAMLARTLVSFDKKVALRLMNLSGQIQTIYKNTVVGVTSPVTDVSEFNQVKVFNSIVAVKEGENIPGHLNELYEEATTDLTEEHKAKVKVILVRYRFFFQVQGRFWKNVVNKAQNKHRRCKTNQITTETSTTSCSRIC